MRVWKSSLVVVLVLGAATSSAQAAPPKPKPKPKTLCNLVTDQTTDATGSPVIGIEYPNDPSMDIVSADIATDAKNVGVVIRLAAYEANDVYSPIGRSYSFNFTVGKKSYAMEATIMPTSTNFGDATGTVDSTKKEIRLTQPLATFSPPIRLGTAAKLTKLGAGSKRIYINGGGGSPREHSVDFAQSTAAYPHQNPSCIRATG